MTPTVTSCRLRDGASGDDTSAKLDPIGRNEYEAEQAVVLQYVFSSRVNRSVSSE